MPFRKALAFLFYVPYTAVVKMNLFFFALTCKCSHLLIKWGVVDLVRQSVIDCPNMSEIIDILNIVTDISAGTRAVLTCDLKNA